MFFTDLKNFLLKLWHEEKIPTRDKKLIVAFFLLVISPIDFIPDWIPTFGLLDDLVLLALIHDYLFNVLDSGIFLSHYPWGMKSYSRLKRFASFLRFFKPSFVSDFIWKFKKDPFR